MQQINSLQFGQDIGWIFLILLVSIAVSYFLYSKRKKPWNHRQNLLLLIIRAVGLFLILVLLLDPKIKQTTNKTEAPIINLLVDNSQSILARDTDSLLLIEKIESIKSKIDDAEIKLFLLNDSDSIDFSDRSSNLGALIHHANKQVEGLNHVASIFLTDGIYNEGISPQYLTIEQPLYVIGLGDTIPPKDISITRIRNNKVVFKGNKTPIQIDISQKGFKNELAEIKITEKGKTIVTKKLELTGPIHQVDFLVPTEKVGLQQFDIIIEPKESEFTNANNKKTVFLDVVEAKSKILIVFSSPHPDIKAIRKSLEATGNYQTSLYNINDRNENSTNENYDLVIFHGWEPNNLQLDGNPGIWYFTNPDSRYNLLNQEQNFLSIKKRGGNPDNVTAYVSRSFSKFKLSENANFDQYPPLKVPFGEYDLRGPTEVLLYQQLGKVKTKKPLMVLYDDGQTKKAVTIGQGIWRWKLQEAAMTGSSSNFDEMITKTAQYLSLKDDKKRFLFQSEKSTFSTSEPVVFYSESYNDIYERVYGNAIKLELIKDSDQSKKTYAFTESELNNKYKTQPLEEGVYSYWASTNIGGKTYTDDGQLVVEVSNPELFNLTADHQLLRSVARKSGGSFFKLSETDQMIEELNEKSFPAKIKSQEAYFPLVESPLYMLLIFLIFSTEWFLRKYWGGY